MGHFIGFNERQVFVDDDGKVYSNKFKTLKLADDIEDILNPEKQKTLAPDTSTRAAHTCAICGYTSIYKLAYTQHMKKHKVVIE